MSSDECVLQRLNDDRLYHWSLLSYRPSKQGTCPQKRGGWTGANPKSRGACRLKLEATTLQLYANQSWTMWLSNSAYSSNAYLQKVDCCPGWRKNGAIRYTSRLSRPALQRLRLNTNIDDILVSCFLVHNVSGNS